MKRRALLIVSAAWILGGAGHALSQQGKPRQIAFVHPGGEAGFRYLFDTFRAELRDLGYVEGRDISIETRWGEGKTERFPSLAREVVALNPSVIVTATSAGVTAFKNVTSSIPIVFATAFNPVEQGFVASLRRPGGNITGIMIYSVLAEKIVEVAREAFPQAQRLAILVHDPDPAHKIALNSFLPSAQRFKFEPLIVRVAVPQDLERAFSEFAERKADILYLPDLAFQTTNRNDIITRSIKARLPLLTGIHDTTAAGGLLSYGTPREENYRRAAMLVDKILRGTKPAELPVEQPDRFTLFVNRKTARAIGANLSPVTMLRADRIID
jgi:putative ABC transport system substrate-binding protein